MSLDTHDLDAAAEFYGQVLGWSYTPGTIGSEFAIAYHGDVPVAGLAEVAGSLRLPVEWLPYFSAHDADVVSGRMVERAGTVAIGPMRFGHGRAVIAADPDGARLGLWQGEIHPRWHAERQQPPGRIDLRTRDAFAAAIFYGEVLDWAQGSGSCEISYEEDTVTVWVGQHLVATLRGGADEAAPDPTIQPQWEVSFFADDLEAAARAAETAGGSVVSREQDSPDGHSVTLRDPEGALFTVRPGRE